LAIGFIGSILRTASMTCDLAAHCRRNSIQAFSYLANRRTASEPSRDLLALTQREREERAPPDRRNKPTVTRRQTTMDECSLPKACPILCNESPAFQRRHTSLFCAAESPNRFPWIINTTFSEKIYIRWCCVDRLSWRRLCRSLQKKGGTAPATRRVPPVHQFRIATRIRLWPLMLPDRASVA
jgi:hypothetical protein